MDKYFHPILYMACDYLSMLGLKLTHVSEKDPTCVVDYAMAIIVFLM